MEFMLDTLNINEIKKWARVLPLAGVTSNPTIAKKEGEIDFFKRIHEVRGDHWRSSFYPCASCCERL